MPREQVIADVTMALSAATTVADACRTTLDALVRYSEVMCAVLLPVHDHLRCVAATGSWQVFSTVAPGMGVVGRVYASGRSEVVENTDSDVDYIPLGPRTVVEIVVPIIDCAGGPIGAMNLEWATAVDTHEWRGIAEEIGRQLGARIGELAGPPAESRGEKLLRHALTLATADSEEELLAQSLAAARDVTGLSTQVLLLRRLETVEINIDEIHPTALAGKIAKLNPADLDVYVRRAESFGASYSLGDPDELNAAGFELLTGLGVRTLIAVPVGLWRESPIAGGVLLGADEEVSHPDAEMVNLVSLLASQAWSSLERLRTQEHLRDLATSDPLTGLRHHGSFGERLAHARPDHTAVFTIDVDGFKTINDTYGHQAGDRALVDLARALSSALRTGDELYRIGGDEFAAIVDVQRTDEALGVAERLVAAARNVRQTISVGVAIHHDGETSDETLRRADTALYVAKRGGRDGVRLAA